MIRHDAGPGTSANNGYVPAPYMLEEGESIRDAYLEPVFFKNENGPTIGVTTCGVIVQDGLHFKDMDNDGELSPFEDWRLTPEERARNMVAHMRLDQQAGLVLNNLWNNPVVRHLEDALDEDGNRGQNHARKGITGSHTRALVPGHEGQ